MAAELEGRVALVTGGARGIGYAVSSAFAQAGAKVLITDVLSDLGTESAARLESETGCAIAFLRHDVTKDADWSTAVKTAVDRFGRLDIVVNNAGIELASLMTEYEEEGLRQLLDVNMVGVMLGLKHAFLTMRPGGASGHGGVVLNIASSAGLMYPPGLSTYAATKAAVAHLTKIAAVEAGRLGHGVRVNCIYPGMIETRMAEKLGEDFAELGIIPDAASMRADYCARVPLGRYGDPSEIAKAALFLCSDASSYVTGGCLPVDGGISIV